MEKNNKGQFKSLELKNQIINGITLLEKTDKKRLHSGTAGHYRYPDVR